MEFNEDDYLQLSGIQHFAFCRRQWAIIHIEKQWTDNYLTIDGINMHEKAHDRDASESRGDLLVIRGLAINSAKYGLSGECDVVEFRRSSNTGISLKDHAGLWTPYPIEYKRGAPKENDADELQLCAEAICLEEMLCCDIQKGALYYGETRHRKEVLFTAEIRDRVSKLTAEMHEMYARGYTPKVKPSKKCNSCSLKEACLPSMLKSQSVSGYIKGRLEDLL